MLATKEYRCLSLLRVDIIQLFLAHQRKIIENNETLSKQQLANLLYLKFC
ncbi:hypothetical protein EMQU_2588 [Enterococcus mundtii QU 25]|uniref:Uncharacterized protein n=1 Tax=Enterococcus mundtii TaxID=53346 RepID=A0AAI8R994_ENTMU|nr:hypothetical protein EMQU_2588 [Enterococcus mundtii QU 25]BBM14419.1 uncharacterized protein EM151A_1183 [Enterococcus mundtii]GKS54850.1 hypothetical protein EMLAB_14650 [Enterococcus mundtii]